MGFSLPRGGDWVISAFIVHFFAAELIIDPHPVSSYNTFMLPACQYFAGFFRPDHDPPQVPCFLSVCF